MLAGDCRSKHRGVKPRPRLPLLQSSAWTCWVTPPTALGFSTSPAEPETFTAPTHHPGTGRMKGHGSRVLFRMRLACQVLIEALGLGKEENQQSPPREGTHAGPGTLATTISALPSACNSPSGHNATAPSWALQPGLTTPGSPFLCTSFPWFPLSHSVSSTRGPLQLWVANQKTSLPPPRRMAM